MSETKLWNEQDYTTWVYKEPRKNNSGGYQAWIDESPTAKRSPSCQLEECTAKFGVADPQEGQENSLRRNLEISVSHEGMQKWLAGLDGQNVSVATRDSKKFFKKDYDESQVNMLYRNCLQLHEKYDPLLRLKITIGGRNKTNVYKVTGKDPETGDDIFEDADYTCINKYARVVPVVSFSSMWYVSRGFGMSILCTDIMVYPNVEKKKTNFVGKFKRRRIDVDPAPPSLHVEQGDNEEDIEIPSEAMRIDDGPL